MRPMVERTCEMCGKPFMARVDAVRRGNGRFCGKVCAAKNNGKGGGRRKGTVVLRPPVSFQTDEILITAQYLRDFRFAWGRVPTCSECGGDFRAGQPAVWRSRYRHPIADDLTHAECAAKAMAAQEVQAG